MKRQDAIAEEVDPCPIAAIEIGSGGASAKYTMPLFSSTASPPQLLLPRSFCKRLRPGVKPNSLVEELCERSIVTYRSLHRMPLYGPSGVAGFTYTGAQDQNVLIDDPRRAGRQPITC